MQPQTTPEPPKSAAPAAPPVPTAVPAPAPATTAPAPAAVPVTPEPAPVPEAVPQPMAVTPEPKADGLALPTVEVSDDPAARSDHPEHIPEPLTEADAHPLPAAPKPAAAPPVPPAGPHAPVGIIVATIIGMIVLCGLAIAIYMTSHASMSM